MDIIVGARPSPLSQAQVWEVFQEMKLFYPELVVIPKSSYHLDRVKAPGVERLQIDPYYKYGRNLQSFNPRALTRPCDMNFWELPLVFQPLWIASKGDKDKKTSLMSMPKDDFFTFEIDQALLDCRCDIAIHSAKDLPHPILAGLKLIALTKGVDPRDALILNEGLTIETLKKGTKIGCSSNRREQAISAMRSDLIPVDIRGTIDERIALFKNGELDGLIVAEAALIRLHLTHLYRILLDIPVDPLQGKLAVLGRKEDEAMKTLFQCIYP